jgi:CheY-like chemotaxis protein
LPVPHQDSGFAGLDNAQSLTGTVLLVEDNSVNRLIGAEMLKSFGVDVVEAEHGAQALEMLDQQRFDLVLMDIQMPVLDGIGATQILRSAGYSGPIVALTANVMASDLQRYREAGCNDVLAKPVERQRFYDVIAAQLASGTARSRVVDDAFEREMAALAADFRAGLPDQLDAIADALARGSWSELRSLAHVLKGTAGSFGFDRLTELSKQIEEAIAAGRRTEAARRCEELACEAQAALP